MCVEDNVLDQPQQQGQPLKNLELGYRSFTATVR